MGPNAQTEGKYLGFLRGFKLQDQTWRNDFQQSDWNDFEYEKALNQENFQAAYLEAYKKGKIQRQDLQQRLQIKLGQISSQDKIIQDNFLNEIFDRFYGISFVLQNWEERIEEEIFPKTESVNSIEVLKQQAINLIEAKRYQRSLRTLKALFMKQGASKLFHQTLTIDLQFQKIRLKSKLKQINRETYQSELQKIEHHLVAMKRDIEK